MIAGVDVGQEALDPIRHELDGPAQQLRERTGRHVVGIDMYLDAKGPAHVLAHHPHLRLGESKVLGDQVLHHVGRLRPLVDGEPPFPWVPVRDNGARLQGHTGVAAEHEIGLGNSRSRGKGRIDLADIEAALERKVVAEIGMDHQGARFERRVHVGHHLERVVHHGEVLRRVLGLGPAAGNHRRDRLTRPAGPVNRHRMLGGGLETLEMRQHTHPWGDHGRKLGPRHHRDHARHGLGRRGVDRDDPRMGMRRAHIDHVRHPRQAHVADILSPALQQPRQVGAWNRAADIRVRPVQWPQAGRMRVAHRAPSARACAVAATASTIAW